MEIVFISLLCITALLFSYVHFYISAPFYEGPKSTHFNGKKFYNPNQQDDINFLDILKWVLIRKPKKWKKPNPDNNCNVIPVKYLKKDISRLTFVNHSTFLIQIKAINILTDPVFSKRVSPFRLIGPKRVREPGVSFDNLPPIHYVLISHNHYDHLDLQILKRLSIRDKPIMIAPLGVSLLLLQNNIRNCIELDWGNKYDGQEGLTFHCVPAQHFSGRGLTDRNRTLWAGFIIENNHKRVYFAGDTSYGHFFKDIARAFPKIDIALLPIGAYKPSWIMSTYHLSPSEAVLAHLDLNARTTVPMHYNTFQMADEGMQEPISDFLKAIKEHSLRANDFKILKESQEWDF